MASSLSLLDASCVVLLVASLASTAGYVRYVVRLSLGKELY